LPLEEEAGLSRVLSGKIPFAELLDIL